MGKHDTDSISKDASQAKICSEGDIRHHSLLYIGFTATLDREDIYIITELLSQYKY